ncbi:hypothetical protein [Ruminococcus sp.]|uniref:hypothetical protein n=1 Tax=Ruminococcus sp. TaxID=41978 RepID=UPI000E92A501|nr:hypothetical protein [Ruminococcus sp.]HBM93556.1 hypothetical protein [Ruminococcus sp.]HCV90280.1 hypothetical protein [Ruminococcus sp.]
MSLEQIEATMEEEGYTIGDLLQSQVKKNSSLLYLNPEQKNKLLDMIKDVKTSNSNSDKGKSLENMVEFLISNNKCFFDIIRNRRTSTNEVDFIVNWSEKARMQNLHNAFDFLSNGFIGECKNHTQKPNVTYVGKFISLTMISKQSIGVLFSNLEITGRNNWDAAKGLIRKVALNKEIYILDINLLDIEKIANGETSLLNLLYAKYCSLKNDIDYNCYIKPHANEGKI